MGARTRTRCERWIELDSASPPSPSRRRLACCGRFGSERGWPAHTLLPMDVLPRNLKSLASSAATPVISVVIPTRHRNDLLSRCLDCLAPGAQTLSAGQYEVIVSD